MRAVFFGAFVLIVLGIVSRADASVLYGSTSAGGAGELWTLNATNGGGIQDIGPLNDLASKNYAVTGLAFNPVTGVLYGSTGGKTGTQLLTINPATALVTVVGNFNAGAATMADIAFDPSGNLYGISSSGGANLYSINTLTGQAIEVGASGFSTTSGGGLAISPGGVFYSTPQSSEFGTYNPTTGAYTHIANPTKPGGAATSYSALAFDGNTLYAMNLATPTHLVTIDSSGNVTDLGPSVANIDGIAFSVPEPASLSLLLSAGGIALLHKRRQKAISN